MSFEHTAPQPEHTMPRENKRDEIIVIDGEGSVREAFVSTEPSSVLPEGTISVGVHRSFERGDLAELTPHLIKRVIDGDNLLDGMPADLRQKIKKVYTSNGDVKVKKVTSTYIPDRLSWGLPSMFLHFDPEVVKRFISDGSNQEAIFAPAGITIETSLYSNQGPVTLGAEAQEGIANAYGVPVVNEYGRLDRRTAERRRKYEPRPKPKSNFGSGNTDPGMGRMLNDMFVNVFSGPFNLGGNQSQRQSIPRPEQKPEDLPSQEELKAKEIIKEATGGEDLASLDLAEQRRAFRRAVSAHHPDAGGSAEVFKALEAERAKAKQKKEKELRKKAQG